MCGIAGLLHLDDGRIEPALVGRMLAQIRHRGPDGQGEFTSGPISLGHARLSIIDLGGGAQPMHHPIGHTTVTFNGEIFNYLELRRDLERRGCRFATSSDTETILHAYEEFGTRCVEHFNGQWAFALWDQARQRLFVSRDRFGVRPLYYTVVGRVLLFASEIKALFAHPEVPREIDPAGLDQVFTYWSTLPPQTMFRGIHELPPAHSLVVEDGRLRVERHWQLDYALEPSPRSDDDYADELLALLTDAVRLRLRSDVPVGAYLSGGLDSSITTALVKQISTKHLRTFSIAFDDPEFDESRFQRQVVERLQTDHQSVRCMPDDIAGVFPDVVWHAERPIMRTAPAPMYLLGRMVHDAGYKVVLTGEGADEMFGGYDIFKEAMVRRFWARQPDSHRRALLFGKLYPYLPNLQAQSPAYLRAFFHVRPDDLSNPLFSHLPRWELTTRIKQFFSAEVRNELAAGDRFDAARALLPDSFGAWHPFCQAQCLETTTLLPGYILSSQGDRPAMAHGVEGRFPFLDYRVVEFAARLPVRLKLRGLQEKYLLKRATRALVPAEITARTKQPYRAPDARCFFPADGAERDYVGELLSPERLREAGLFDADAVERLVAKARRGQVVSMKDNMALVGILSTQLLVDRFIHHFPAREQETTEPLAALV